MCTAHGNHYNLPSFIMCLFLSQSLSDRRGTNLQPVDIFDAELWMQSVEASSFFCIINRFNPVLQMLCIALNCRKGRLQLNPIKLFRVCLH